MRHVLAVTPIHVDEVELARRRRRYADLAPDCLEVHLVDVGRHAPSRLETEEDLSASEKAAGRVLAAPDAARYDVRLPDCVLDPCVPAEPARDPPHGMLRLCLTHLASAGHRISAVTRNAVIGEELRRRVERYGFGDVFLGLRVLDLDVGSIAEPERWDAAMAGALEGFRACGVTAVINGCSAVDVAPASGDGPVVVDPAAAALRIMGDTGE